LLSPAALLFAGALVIGTSVPASAFFVDNGGTQDGPPLAVGAQSITVAGAAATDDATRAKYSIGTEAPATILGLHGGAFTPTTGSVRWPYPFATTITDGFGPRKSPCAGCSTFHKGTDFVPGAGVTTYAIADGVVESSVVSNAGLGNEVIIKHEIKGQTIESVYGHLQMNSSPLRAGDKVKVGDVVGKVGATGTTTGANMHLEVHVNGVPVDPFKWLTANATNDD
jgi:murein DD-endopeptidase MepM/ murein hydrolase activator NlpD